jgi:hypothetical protein
MMNCDDVSNITAEEAAKCLQKAMNEYKENK